MRIIKQHDVIESIRDAFQYISYYHPRDFIQAMHRAYLAEQSAAARDALAQILINSRMCAQHHRPICQDTGTAVVFVKVGMNIRWDAELSLQEMINEGVRQAYTLAENPLRASIVRHAIGNRENTRDNTPAIIYTDVVAGDGLEFTVAAKGGGSENKARFAVLNPNDSVVDWILRTLPGMGSGWCPPGILGIGIGGSPDKAMLMAKEALMEPVDIDQLLQRTDLSPIEQLRVEIYNKVNALGIGAQGLGGLTTVLDVKIHEFPTHAASLPVALIPNCAATRHLHFALDGSGPALLTPPRLEDWPDITQTPETRTHRVNIDTITRDDIAQWRPGDSLLLSGHLLTGRDAAHKRICALLESGQPLPDGIDFQNRFIYYVGPVDAVDGEAVGPAGPTTSSRMDKFSSTMLGKGGLLGMIGKAECGPQTLEGIPRYRAVYLVATGGAAYLISKSIRSARVLAFPELGMEAIYEFVVEDMPVTVAVDTSGHSIHQDGPAQWQKHILRQLPR